MLSIREFAQQARQLITDDSYIKNLPEDKAGETGFVWLLRLLAVRYMQVAGCFPEAAKGFDFAGKCAFMERRFPDVFYSDALPTPPPALQRLIGEMDDRAFANKPEVIGDIYQYYIADLKDEVFMQFQQNIRITKDRLPIATQIFTPMWLAEYLVQNALGTLCGIRLDKWRYFVGKPKSAQTLRDITGLTLIDPCMGSGHILLCAFDVLMDVYLHHGFAPPDAAKYILQNNLYGLDIDDKACRLACFALLMKAHSCGVDIFAEDIRHNLCVIEEDDAAYKNAKELGSLLQVCDIPMPQGLMHQTDILKRKYDAVVTNPPYMGRKRINVSMAAFLKKYYPMCKSELYSAFIIAGIQMLKDGGVCAMLTPHTWLFISSFSALRQYVLSSTAILSLVHSGAATFEGINAFNALAAAFCLQKSGSDEPAVFIRLTEYLTAEEKQRNFHNPQNRYTVKQKSFTDISGSPFVYTASKAVMHAFAENQKVSDCCQPRQGLATGDNSRFVRYWFEVPKAQIGFGFASTEAFHKSGKAYAPYNKGGSHRKWYGGNDYVIAFDGESYDVLSKQGNNLPSRRYYFKEGITWSLFGFENFSVRYKPMGFVFDVSGSSMFPDALTKYMLGFLSSKAAFLFLSTVAPTVNFQVGNIAGLPFVVDEDRRAEVEKLVDENISISKQDWDSFEASWDFETHPLVKKGLIADNFEGWESACQKRYQRLKANEERINTIFIDIFGLQGELCPAVSERDIAVRKADLKRDVQSLVSYVTGYLFGRFGSNAPQASLTFDGLTEGFAHFVDTHLGYTQQNLEFIAGALGGRGTAKTVIRNYYEKHFYKVHFKAYKKRPIYLANGSGLSYRFGKWDASD